MDETSINIQDLKIEDSLFKDVKFYISGQLSEQTLEILAHGGAEKMTYFSDYVTHLICGKDPEEQDVSDATEVYEIPAITEKWVLYSAKLKRKINTKLFKFETNYIFEDMIFSFSNIYDDINSLWALITYNGGLVKMNLDQTCTHLCTTDIKSEKYEKAFSLGEKIKIVTPDWVFESVRNKQLSPYELFHPKLLTYPKPRESTALITGFEQDDTEKVSDIPETDSTQALLDQLKQRMPWNQPASDNKKIPFTAPQNFSPPKVRQNWPQSSQNEPATQVRPNFVQNQTPQAQQVPQRPQFAPQTQIRNQNPMPQRSQFQNQFQNQEFRAQFSQAQSFNQNQINQQFLQNKGQRPPFNQWRQQLQHAQLGGQLGAQVTQQLGTQISQINQGQGNQIGQLGSNQQTTQIIQQNLRLNTQEAQNVINQQINQNQHNTQLGSQQIDTQLSTQQIQNQQIRQISAQLSSQQINAQLGSQQIDTQLNTQQIQNQQMRQISSQLSSQQIGAQLGAQLNQQLGQIGGNQVNTQLGQNQQLNQLGNQGLNQQIGGQISSQGSQIAQNINQLLNQNQINQTLSLNQQNLSQITQNLSQQNLNLSQNLNQQNLAQNLNQQSLAQNLGQQNLAQNLSQQNLGQNLSQQNMSQNLSQQNLAQNLNQQNLVQNLSQQNLAQNLSQQNLAQNLSQQNLSQNMNQQNLSQNMNQQNLSQNMNQQNLVQNLSQQTMAQNLSQQNLAQNLSQQNLSQNQGLNQQMSQNLSQNSNLSQLSQQNLSQNINQQQLTQNLGNQQGLSQMSQQILNMQLNSSQHINQIQTKQISQVGLNQQLANQQLTNQQLSNQQLSNQQLSNQQLSNQQLSNQQLSNQQLANQQLTNQQLTQSNQQLNNSQLTTQQINVQMPQNQIVMTSNQILNTQIGQINQQIGLQQQQIKINQPINQINQGLNTQVMGLQQQIKINQQINPQIIQQQQIINQNQPHLVRPQIGAPRLNWSPNQQGIVPQRQFIHLDAQTHQQLQQMDPAQRTAFIARIQKHRLMVQRQILQQHQRGGHIVIRGGAMPPGLSPQQQVQWLQQQGAKQQVVMQGPQNVVAAQHAPGLSPIAQNTQQIGDQNQQIQIQRQQQFQRLQQLQLQREQAQKQQSQMAQPAVAAVPRPALTPQVQTPQPVETPAVAPPPAAADGAANSQQLVVNAKTKTALANMLSIRLQSGSGNIPAVPEGEPSAAGTLRMMTAQHNASLNPATRPQELLAIQQRRALGNITNGEMARPPAPAPVAQTPGPEVKQQFSPGRALPPQPQRHGPFYGHNPNLKLPPDLFLLGCIFVVVEIERFLEDASPDWRQVIEKHGGEIEPVYCTRVTHVLCETQRHGVVMQALRDFKRCVTLYWLNDVVQRKQVVPPWQALHLPTGYIDGAPASRHLISLSGFHGSDRGRVIDMVKYTGAKFTPYFSRHNTVLVCGKAEGSKFQHAKKWNTPIVNVQWVTDLMLGNFSALNQIEHVKYQQFTQPVQFGFDTALVPNLMFAWKMPINISQESYERVKRSPSPVIMPPKPKKIKTEQIKTEPCDTPMEVVQSSEISSTHSIMFSVCANKNELEDYVRKLGGSLATNMKNATHLVMGYLGRTPKLLNAITLGLIIVPDNWLRQSFEEKKFLSETSFKFDTKEFNNRYKCDFYKTQEVKSREKLFSNKIFFITPTVYNPLSELKEIIELAGGIIEKKRRSLQQIEAVNTTVPFTYTIITVVEDLHLVYDCLRNGNQKFVSSSEVVFNSILNQKFNVEEFLVKIQE